MQNTKNKLILGIATLVAVFGFATNAMAATAPVMSTSSATYVTTTSATLNGFFNDGGSPMTQLYFDYGTSPLLGTLSPLATIPAGSSGNYSVTLTGLTPGTTYYVQAVGTNGMGSTWGNPTVSFTTKSTSSVKPVMSTNSATSITSNSATLNGFYNMNGVLGSVYFEYGLSSTSLNSTTSSVSVSSNSGNYSIPVSGLNSNTIYYFRAVGVNANGTTQANTILSFTTTNGGGGGTKCYISSFTSSSYNVTSGSPAYLSWSTNNCTSATLTPSGYSALSASSYTVYPTYPSITYTLTATNGSTNDTSSITITVNNYNPNPNPNPNYNDPTAITYAASNITANSAMLNGYVNGNGSSADAWFEYGTTRSLGRRTSSQSVWYGSNANIYINGLANNTTYYYRVVAQNANGNVRKGSIMSFTTISGYYNGGNGPVYTGGTGNDYTTVRSSDKIINETKYVYEGGGNAVNGTSATVGEGIGFNDNSLAAAAGMSGSKFLPGTFIGWLLIALIILIIVLVFRHVTAKNNNSHSTH